MVKAITALNVGNTQSLLMQPQGFVESLCTHDYKNIGGN